jgi:hypothetical protein
MAKWKEIPSPESIVRAALETAGDAAENYCSDMPDLAGHGHSVGLRDAIRALSSDPAEVAKIIKKAGGERHD